MTAYLILNSPENVEFKNLRIGTPKLQTGSENHLYAPLRYLDPRDNSRKEFYLQTPSVMTSNLQWGTQTAFLELYLCGQQARIGNFMEFLNKLDVFLLQKVWEQRVHWKLEESTPIMQIEKNWVSTLKISNLDYRKSSLKFKIPIRDYNRDRDDPTLELDIYDQEGDELPIGLLKPEYPARALLYIGGIRKQDDFFYLDLELKQLKVKIPEQIFEDCQLSDVESEPEKKLIWDILEEEGLIESFD